MDSVMMVLWLLNKPLSAFRLQLSNLGVRALVEYCKSTLTSLDLSGCTGLNDEASSGVLHWSANGILYFDVLL